MARCILHVGMHKTGTTSIQNSLHHYVDDSFYYARLANSPNHSLPVYSLFADHPERHHLHRGRAHDITQVLGYNEAVRNDFLTSVRESGGRTVVISGEDIAILKKEEVAKLRDFLALHFEQIDVYAYIRPPGSFMSSAFQQTVRSGRQVGLNLPKLYRNLRASFQKFDDLFGRERVHLKKFDRALLHKGDAVLDFCQQIGLPLPEGRVVKSNEGSSKEFTALLLQYNRFCKDNNLVPITGSEAAVLERALSGIGKTKFRFAPSLLRPVIEENREDIAWMEERLGTSLDETSAEDMPTDVHGEEDLLAPMPGLLAAMESAAHDAGLTKRPAFADVQSLVFHAFRNAAIPQKGPGAARAAAKKLRRRLAPHAQRGPGAKRPPV